jgi:hypothetical protein
MRRRFEFDVTVQAQASSAPDWRAEQREVQRHALSHRLQAAQQAARELYAKAFDAVPDAQAIAVRALD